MMIISMSNGLAPAVRAVSDEQRPAPPPASAPVSVPTQAQVQQAAQMINKAIQSFSSNLEFSVDDAAVGKTVVKVVDRETGEMIRQIPSQEALDIARALDRLQGLLIRNQA